MLNTNEREALNEVLEDSYRDAVQNNDSLIAECETGVDFENWLQSGTGFAEYDSGKGGLKSYAKHDLSGAGGDIEVYVRNDSDKTWNQFS